MKKTVIGLLIMSLFLGTFSTAFAQGSRNDNHDEYLFFTVTRDVFSGYFEMSAHNDEVLFTQIAPIRGRRNIEFTSMFARNKQTGNTELLFEMRRNIRDFYFIDGKFYLLTNEGVFTSDINGENVQLIIDAQTVSFAVSDSGIFYCKLNPDTGRFQIMKSDLTGNNRVTVAENVGTSNLTIVDGGVIFSDMTRVGKISDDNQVDVFITNLLVPMPGGETGTYFVANNRLIITGYTEPEDGKYGRYPTIIMDLDGNVITVWENTWVHAIQESNGRIYANISNLDERGQFQWIRDENENILSTDGGIYYISNDFMDRHFALAHGFINMYIHESSIYFRSGLSWQRGDVLRDGTIENLVNEPIIVADVNNIEVLVTDNNPVGASIHGEAQYRGELLSLDLPPMIKDGQVLLPIRRISEAMGAEIDWNVVTRTATIEHNDMELRLQIGNNVFHLNDEENVLVVPAEVINNRLFVPLQVFRALGAQAEWDEDRRAVWIWTGPRIEHEDEW